MTVMYMHNFFLMFDQIIFTGKTKFGKSIMYVCRKTIQKRILEKLCVTVMRVNKELRKGRFVKATGRPAAARAVSVWVGSTTAEQPVLTRSLRSLQTCAHKVPVRCQQGFQPTTVRFSLFFLRYSRRLVATGFQVGANSDAPTRNWQNIKDLHTEQQLKNLRHPTASTYCFC